MQLSLENTFIRGLLGYPRETIHIEEDHSIFHNHRNSYCEFVIPFSLDTK